MNFNRTLHKLQIYGRDVELRTATTREHAEFSKKVKDADPVKILKASNELLIKVGMPEDLVDELEPEHTGELLKLVNTSKKK